MIYLFTGARRRRSSNQLVMVMKVALDVSSGTCSTRRCFPSGMTAYPAARAILKSARGALARNSGPLCTSTTINRSLPGSA